MKKVKLGIPGQVQQSNASLAVALVQEHLEALNIPAPEITSTTLAPEVITLLWKMLDGQVDVRLVWKRMSHGIVTEHIPPKVSLPQLSGILQCISILSVTKIVLDLHRRQEYSYSINRRVMLQLLYMNYSPIRLFTLIKLYFALILPSKMKDINMVSSSGCSVYLSDLMSINTSTEAVGSLKVQHGLKQAWEELSKDSETFVVPTIEEAVEMIRSWNGEKEVFVTGSLHLIGGLYVVLDEGQHSSEKGFS